MSSIDPASPFSSDVAAKAGELPSPPQKLRAVEAILERLSEQLNPILVKEARQALKSKQFMITFTLLLVCGWAWSLLGVALLSPGVYFAPGGRFMLSGYYLVLTVPLLVIVPFAAFRSLAAEREDGTFELLSITSLSARQIVTGKLGSAVLQALVYYSALAPCIAFTYLLRGVDILTILVVLVYNFVACVMLSALGLMMATITRARHWQVLLSVLLLIALLFFTFVWSISFLQLISMATPAFDDAEFWIAQATILSVCATFLVLFILVSASQISFASDNRSTRLRITMCVQHVVWIGWMAYWWLIQEGEEFLFIFMMFAGIYWFLMGVLMCGEYARLSPRVKRSLPQSFFGRMAFTWFNPGSGTGYAFAMVNLTTFALAVAAIEAGSDMVGLGSIRHPLAPTTFGFMIASYCIIYLGLGRLVILLLRKLAHVGMLLCALVQVFLALAGVGIPLFFQAWLQGYSRLTYSSLQMTNWIWTLVEVVEGKIVFYSGVPVVIYSLAAVMFIVNLVLASFEVEQVRAETPDRVVADDQAMQPAEQTARNPLDD